ncbi:hypothetical protein ATERTT37_000200 [Aspergillus terreus]
MARSKAKARAKAQKATPKRHAGNKFTMQEEARNTEGRNLWRTGLQLRHKAVQFVSAGDLEREDNPETPQASEKREEPETIPEETTVTPPSDHQPAETTTAPSVSPSLDTLGEGVANAEISDPDTERMPADQDESSEDEIVFLGRQRRKDPAPQLLHRDHQMDTNDTNRDSQGSTSEQVQPPERPGALPSTTISDARSATPELDYIDFGMPRRGRKSRSNRSDDEDGAIADYIANMDNDYLEGFNTPSSSSSSEESDGDDNLRRATKAPTTGDFSTRSDPLATIETEESMGVATNLDLVDEESGLDTYTPKDPLEAYDESGTDTDSEDDVGDRDPYSQEIEDLLRALEESSAPSTSRRNRPKGRPFAPATAFADALEMDPYYGLDMMDFDRPSLRKKKKGKHLPLDMVLSDSDLEMELERAWKNDREKKRIKKQQREQLRAQGLLGRKSDDPDMKSKYALNMGFDDLKVEIRTFMLSSKNSLSLPPMTKHRRKVIHDLAHDLSLNSQSRGKGSSRFPILHKTSRTPKHTRKTISQVDSVFSKGKFKYGGAKIWEQHTPKSAKSRRGGRPEGAVSYMDGDVVGGSAPEIGAGNKGRAMLEKMGWSTGTALGAANNKGILLPVAHVVKNSKAGLG